MIMTDALWKGFLNQSEKEAIKSFKRPCRIEKEKLPRSLAAIPTVEVLAASYCKTQNIPSAPAEVVFPGNCHSVAIELKKFLGDEARVVRGHYWGDNELIKQHSWLEYRYHLVDPTRFQFECKPDYIFKGQINEPNYDKFSVKTRGLAPHPLPERSGEFYRNNLSLLVRKKLNNIYKTDRNWMEWTVAEMHCIATTNPVIFGKSLRAIMTEIIRAGHRALIPIDVINYYNF